MDYNRSMNERLRCKNQSAEICEDLAETYAFLGKVNWELAHPIKAGRGIKKAFELKSKADNFRQEAEQIQTSLKSADPLSQKVLEKLNLNISKAGPEMTEKVAKLVESANLDTTYLPQANPLLIVTNEQNEAVGCVGLERRGDIVHLQSLAVRVEYRKKGIGSVLVENAFQHLNEGETLVALTLFWNNGFYKKRGFEKLNAKEVKSRDDVGSREKHIHCTAWGRKKEPSE
jgi:N-acetylglutamate synthase-like GNAT family acetyltransferase